MAATIASSVTARMGARRTHPDSSPIRLVPKEVRIASAHPANALFVTM